MGVRGMSAELTSSALGKLENRSRDRLVDVFRLVCFVVGALAIVGYFSMVSDRRADLAAPVGALAVAIDQSGIHPDTYAAFAVALEVALVSLAAVLALVIFLGTSDRAWGGFLTLMIATLGAAIPTSVDRLIDDRLPWDQISWWTAGIGWSSFVVFLYLFPDGRFTPRWTMPLAVVRVVSVALGVALPDTLFNAYNWPAAVRLSEWAFWFGSGIAAQAYFYSRVATREQRQQTKWVTASIAMSVVAIFLTAAPGILDPSLRWTPFPLLVRPVAYVAALLTFGAIALSIRRYRLWKIDLIVNRALVYGFLTAVLAGIYTASIKLFQAIFSSVTGDRSDAAVVITTLILAASFTPLKNRLQTFFDRYVKETNDPAKPLRALAEQTTAVLDVVDAERLGRRLVDETVDAFGARGGAIFVERDGALDRVYETPDGDGDGRANIPMRLNGGRVGCLLLGWRDPGRPDYGLRDLDTLQEIVDQLAPAVHRDEETRRSAERTAAAASR